jgi:hypothetical protein
VSPETIHRNNHPLQMLAELADIAMELARAAGRKALEQIETAPATATEKPAQNHTQTFTRLARVVKEVLALETRITADPAKPRGEKPRYQQSGPIHDPRRNRIAQCVRDAAKRNVDGPPLRDLNRYLEDRLQNPDIDQTLADNLPVSAAAEIICQDLGLDFSYAWVHDEDLKRPRPIPKPPDG